MRFVRILLVLLFAASPAIAADNSASYYVPPAQFTASVQILDMGMSNAIGLFGNGTASFSFDDGAKTLSGLKIAVDMSSLVAGNSHIQNNLAGLLGIFQFGEARFTALDASTFQDGKASIKGTLTLKGVSKPMTVDAVLNKVGKSPHGGGMFDSEGDAVGLSLHGSVKRSDFGMPDDPTVPNRFGDTLYFQFELQGLKQ